MTNPWTLPGHGRMYSLYRLLGMIRPERRIPDRISVSGLTSPVSVEWDEAAVPSIRAASLLDAVRVQGWIHGRMRGFQMDLLRRMPSGTLSELLGPGGLPYDTFMRQLNLARWAESSRESWSPDVQRVLDAYADGVNQAWTSGPLAPEYRFLKLRPRPWTASDSSVLTYFLSWSLNSIWTGKWARDQIAPGSPADKWLFGPLTDLPTTTIIPNTGDAEPWGTLGIGSNNWVVSGGRTADGNPLLANDPHLAPQLPSIWFQNAVQGGDLDVLGVSLPGAPGIVIGQNRHIAWGVTNVDPDCQDLHRIHMQDETHYLLDGEMTELSTRVETIRVRGSADMTLTCEESHAGPVIYKERDGSRIALAWTGFAPIETVPALIDLNLAPDWESFRSALKRWTVPAQNFVYADKEGHIGYVLGGHVPERPEIRVLGVVDGNTRATLWTQMIDFEDMPQVFDPPQGFVVTANNGVEGHQGTHRIGARNSLGYRAQRIVELLESRPQHDVESFQEIQTDVFSKPLWQLAERLRAEPDLPSSWRPILEHFDGRADSNSPAPTLLYLWMMAAVPESVQNALKESFFPDVEPSQPGTHPFPENFWGLMGERLAPAVLTHYDELDRISAFSKAEQRAVAAFGPDMSQRHWGNAHPVLLFHPFTQVKAVEAVFGRKPVPVSGDFFTPLQTAFPVDPDLPWPRPVAYLPSYRQILKPGQPALSVFVHLTGQSGHPGSDHYDDLVTPYAAGMLKPVGHVAERTTFTP